MEEIIVYDSGIGGIPVLCQLQKNFPQERFIYFSDPLHMPYGAKTKDELRQIAAENFAYFQTYTPKAVVIACNTMSGIVSKEKFINVNYPIFGMEQPLEKALEDSEKKVLFLSTQRTAERISLLVRQHSKQNCKIYYSNTLASEVETAFQTLSDIRVAEIFSPFSMEKYNVLFLGCTHYIWLKQILQRLYPHLKIEDGVEELIFQIKQSTLFNLRQAEKKANLPPIISLNAGVHFIGEGSFKNQNAYLFFIKFPIKKACFTKKRKS